MSARDFQPVHMADAVGWFNACSDRFGELSALFDVLAKRIDKHDDLRKLATLGKDAAQDYENVADLWREELEKGGFRNE
jgi:hypothetical protein